MGAKELVFADEAREKLKAGIDKLADVVSPTLGPKGRNVGLDSFGSPKITNDGNSIAFEVELKDQWANMGVQMGKEAAAKMKEECGDGTTTTLLLMRAIVQGGVKYLSSGHSPIMVKRGIEKAVEAVVKEVEKMALPVKTEGETLNIAKASASGDEEVGKIIASAIKKGGSRGVISIEEGKTIDTTVEIVEGMQFDKGYLSAYFATDADSLSTVMENPYVLITDKKISSAQDILSILQSIASTGSSLLIIAEDVEGEALSTLVINKLRGTLKVCAVKAPSFGDTRKAMLEDLAILTGGTLITDALDGDLQKVTLDQLGRVEKAEVTKDKTLLMGGQGDHQALSDRIKMLEQKIDTEKSSYDKEKLQERKAKLSDGVVVIHVGSHSEAEMKRKKQLFEDSLSSTQAAIEMGYVPGGGLALLRAASALDSLSLGEEEMAGVQIVKKALFAPFKQLVLNTGYDSSVILDQVLGEKKSMGFHAGSEKVEDLLKAGIIDPAKVVIFALRYAASSAEIVLLTETLIGDAPEEDS